MKSRATVICAALLAAGFAASAWAMSAADEVRIGRRVMREVRGLRLTADPAVERIGKRLADAVERKDLPWRFWVVEDLKSYNAFAAPGGFVFITRDYLEKLSEDEAAFVIAHEMAHIDLGHYERQVDRRREASFGNLLLKILTDGAGAWGTAADLGATAYMTHYSRVLEKEADFQGYKYAEAAGYDARAAVSALSKLGEDQELHPWIQNIYATHPLLSSREDRLAALGGEEPEEVEERSPSPSHSRDLTEGLKPLDPRVPIAVRILSPDGTRWENRWRKDFTKHLHLRLVPLGFTIAGDDIMYKPDIGDPVETARSRGARYLLFVTVHRMASTTTGEEGLVGAPVRAEIDAAAKLVEVETRDEVWQGRLAEEGEGVDALPADRVILYTDTCIGALAEKVAGQIACGCAVAAGARPAKTE